MTLTPSQLDDAEAIARAATQGEWMPDLGEPTHSSVWTSDIAVGIGYGMCQEDASHIARFSPVFVLELIEEIRQYRKDAEDAAGELLVDLLEPGTVTAKLISANVLMRKERDEARAEIVRLNDLIGSGDAFLKQRTDQRDAARGAYEEARAEAARYRKLLVSVNFYYGGDTHSGIAERIRAALDAKTEGGGDE